MVDATRADGLGIFPTFLDGARAAQLLAEVREVMRRAPPFRPTMPGTAKPFSVLMTNAGPLGWLSDRAGYRYEPRHPQTGRPWPPIPATALSVWREVTDYPVDPEACLVNIYGAGARMGLHQDRDEAALDAPVVSISLGNTGLFRIGGPNRRDPTRSLRLVSGDVVVLAGRSRMAFHGIDRILRGTSRLLPEGGRINLTLRRVTRP